MSSPSCSTAPCLFGSWNDQQLIDIRKDPSAAKNNDYDDFNIATKIQELDHEEREKALHDLHGVSDVIEEPDEFIAEKLEDLDMEMEKISIPNRRCFDLAVKQSVDYVKNLRLAFLRAARFDTKMAATRMVKFFELKRTLFGESKLTKDITWDDLSEKDKIDLRKGSIQLLPQRDRAGRAVIVGIGQLIIQETVMTQIRLMFFVCMMAMKDEETQKRGMVHVQYNVGLRKFDLDKSKKFMAALPGMPPIRVAAYHNCYDNPIQHIAIKCFQLLLFKTYNDATRVCRFRAHHGSHLECQYALMAFGIIKDFIPVSPKGRLRLNYHHQWLNQIQKDHYASSSTTREKEIITLVPDPMDVVLGRGRHGTNAPGNVRYKLLLQEKKESYDSASDKARVVYYVIKELKESGTRFLKREEGGWVEIPDHLTRYKISQAFRNLRTGVGSSNVSRALNKKCDK